MRSIVQQWRPRFPARRPVARGAGAGGGAPRRVTGRMEAFEATPEEGLPVRGFLHRPPTPAGDVLVLAHGAGANCDAPLLVGLAPALADAGLIVLRVDLPFRQARPSGPPLPSAAPRDREGLRSAARIARRLARGRVFLGGHSYGGRQASILVADEPEVAAGLVLFSYPLHPPRRPEAPRTGHFPRIRVPALFVHGARDPFGSLDEMRLALALVPAPTTLMVVDGAGHDLGPLHRPGPASRPEIMARVVAGVLSLGG